MPNFSSKEIIPLQITDFVFLKSFRTFAMSSLFILLLVICRLRCSDAKARFFFLAAIPGCGDCFGVAYRIKAANKHEKVVAGFYNGAAE